MEPQVAVPPIQRPHAGGLHIAQSGDRGPGPLRTHIRPPQRPALHDCQMPIRDIDLDANLATDTLGHPASAPPLHSGHISLRQNTHPTSVQSVPLRRSLKSARRQLEPHDSIARICLSLSAIPLAAALLCARGASAAPPSAVTGADAVIAKAESAIGSDMFGPYGCEAFVAYAYGVPQAQYGWDGAAETIYENLLAQGQIHADMSPPRGGLVFSKGSDGPHIDIARGDGTYISGGVQGLDPGYGDGHNIQILPSPNVGPGWLYRGSSILKGQL
jgi:hypothetical protein